MARPSATSSNPYLPADAGLGALGLIMRIGGTFGIWIGVFILLTVMMMPRTGMSAIVLLLGPLRSWAHNRAGQRLQQSAPEAQQAIWVYIGLAVVHLIAIKLISVPNGLEPMINMLFIFSLMWPLAVLALTMRPAAQRVMQHVRTRRQRVFAEDGGLVGTAALMAAVGTVGACLVLVWLIMALSAGVMKAGIAGVLTLIIGLAFFSRSFLHAKAGINALRAFNPTRFRADCDRYFGVSVLTTVLLCLLVLIGSISGGIVAFLMILPVGAICMAWPSIVRNVGAVELRPDLEDDPPALGVGRDNGVVTLGFALIAVSTWSVAIVVAPLLGVPLGGSMAMSMQQQPMWMSAAFGALTIWAGLECIGMTPRRRIAAAAYLVAAVLSFGYGVIEVWSVMGELSGPRMMMGGQIVWVLLATMATSLALPIVVAVQVLRAGPPQPVDVDSVF